MVAVARKELAWETDYIREAKCQNTFRCVEMVPNIHMYVCTPVHAKLESPCLSGNRLCIALLDQLLCVV